MQRQKLEKIRKYTNLIYTHTLRIEELRLAAAYGSRVLDPIGGSHGSPANRLEILLAQIDKEERKLDAVIDKRYDAVISALKAAKTLDDVKLRHVIYLRYMAIKKNRPLEWQEIIAIMRKRHNIQERRIYELHHIALKKLETYNI